MNGKGVKTRQDFYDLLKKFHVEDTIKVQTANKTADVILESYKTPSVHITKVLAASNEEKVLYKRWEKAE